MVKNVEKWDFSSSLSPFLQGGGECSVQVQSDVQWMDFFFFLNFFTSFFPLNSTKCRYSKEVLYWDHPQLFFLACPHIQIKNFQFIWRSQIFLHLNQLSQKSRRNFCLKVFHNVLRR